MKKVIIAILLLTLIFGCVGETAVSSALESTSVGNGISENQSKVVWESAEPFGIIDYSQSGSILSLVIKNNVSENLLLTTVMVSGQTVSPDTTLEPGKTTVVKIEGLELCTTGDSFAYNPNEITFAYDTSFIAGKTQIGLNELRGTCS